jgi:putative cardiolipin synthase
MRYLKFIVLYTTLIIFGGCSAVYIQDLEPKDKVVRADKSSTLLKYFNNRDKALKNKSAFYSLAKPLDALASRLFLIDNAKSTLDIQYYIFEDDNIGQVFATHLLLASQRGVKVRLLLDDLSTAGKDNSIATLSSHKNIEVKVFNPNRYRNLFRNVSLVLNLNKLGKRMHNKALIADGVTAIVGGRNIGDVYFASNSETLFLDYDVLVVGSIMPEINKEFSIYWNSKESKSSSKIISNIDEQSYLEVEKSLKQDLIKFNKSKFGKALANSKFNKDISRNRLKLTVADKTELYYDYPSKVSTDEDNTTSHISSQLSKNITHIDKRVVIISPYLIPSKPMLNALKKLRDRDVKVVVVTNSLSSTDVSPVYSGYKEYIKPLLNMGVELYELKPNSFDSQLRDKNIKKLPSISLHTKMIVIDNKKLIIGSANLDPRSNKLNTELLMIIKSTKLAKEQNREINSVINLNNFYKLILKEDRVFWKTVEDKKIIFYQKEPNTSTLKRCGVDIMRLLPIKGYL